MKVLILGDMHLSIKKPIGRLDEDWLATLIEKFNQITAIYLKKGCQKSLSLGDIFHYQEEYMVEHYYNDIRKFLNHINLKESLIGNHDSKDINGFVNKTSFGLFDLRSHWDLKDLPIKGYSYYEREKFYTEDNPPIVAIHDYITPTPLSFPWETRGVNEIKHLPKLVLLGHDHSQKDFTCNGCRFVQPGAIFRRARNEKFTPQVTILDTDTLQIEYIPLKVTPYDQVFAQIDPIIINPDSEYKVEVMENLTQEKFKKLVDDSKLDVGTKKYINNLV